MILGQAPRVVNIHTIKPIDTKVIVETAKKVDAIIVAEEHSIIGGLSSAVSEVFFDNEINIKMARIGINDRFGESGDPADLMNLHGLTAENLVNIGQNIL